MEIESKEFTIKMTHDELWKTAWDVRYNLENTLKTHWVNHQQNWKENEAGTLNRLRVMFTHLGRVDLYEDMYKMADGIFKDFNNKKQS